MEKSGRPRKPQIRATSEKSSTKKKVFNDSSRGDGIMLRGWAALYAVSVLLSPFRYFTALQLFLSKSRPELMELNLITICRTFLVLSKSGIIC